MTLRRLALISLPVAMALTGLTASAQAPADDWSRCRGDDDEVAIAGCSALLQAGQLSPAQRGLALSRRAIAYHAKRDFPHAVADYEEALRLNPREIWAHAGLALSLRDSGNAQRAVGEFDSALSLAENDLGNAGPQSPEYERRTRLLGMILLERGETHKALHNGDQAIADFREGLRRSPHDPDLGNALCWTLAERGEALDEARRACDQSLRDRPNHAPTLDSRGLVGLKQHRFQDAWNDYDAATRLGEGPSWVFGRGVAALRLGRTAEGQADIARAEAMSSEVRQFYAEFGIRP